MKRKKLIKAIFYSMIGATSIALIVVVLFWTNLIHTLDTTINKATTIEPETFTELYFENHTELPLLVAAPNEFTWYFNPTSNLYRFAFTIHNLENKNMLYTYEVYSFENEKEVIDQGEVFIKNNESKTIVEQFTLPNDYTRTKITVNLINKNQQLSFWMEEYNK